MRRFRLAIVNVAVHDFIFPLIQIQQNVQLVQTGGFGFQFFLLRERLLHGNPGVGKLNSGVFQQFLAGVDTFFYLAQGIVQALNIAENVSAQRSGISSSKKESMAIIRPIGTPEIGQKTGKSLTPTTSGAAFRIFRRQP